MTHEPQPDPRPSDLLLTAEVLLHRLFPSRTQLSSDEIQLMTLNAGVWALQAEADAHRRELPQLLSRQLISLRKVPEVVPKPPAPATLPPGDMTEIRKRFEALGQPWSLKRQVRDNVTQTSYRTYPAFLAKVQTVQGPGERASNYDLQITLAFAYLALPRLRTRVNTLLRLRYNPSVSMAGLKAPSDAALVAAALQDGGLPWRGRVTLRRSVRQVAMRVTTDVAAALKDAPPAELRCTIADLHTTLLALYLIDAELRAHVQTLLLARAQA